MPMISSAIPNLIQGVSQQSPPLRLSSQAEKQENAFPSLVEGLQKRPPLEHVARISQTETTGSYVHLLNRSEDERYFALINSSNQIDIYDLVGNQKTVTYPDGTDYLTTSNPSTAFRAVTVADYTFIVNTEKTPAYNSNLSPTNVFKGLIAVKQGDYNQRYTVYLDGSQRADITTSEDDNIQTRTTSIATRLASAINSYGGFSATSNGSTVIISKTGNASFDIATYDSLGDTGMTSTTGIVQRFDDLPAYAPHNYVAQVQGDQTNNFDDYYVKFISDHGNNSALGSGTWVETIQPNISYELDPATMPHLLIRQADGSFTLEQGDWGDRAIGDLNSSPTPSFVGRKISDVFFFQNRLGFLSGENVVMSRTSEYFDFFKKTARTVLDNDPIDVAASHTKVSTLKHAIPFDRKLLLFSDQTQFILKGSEYITPKNTSIAQTTEYEASSTAKPAAAGNLVYFSSTRGGFTSIREYYVIDDTDRSDATDVTSHVAKYVPDNLYSIAVSTAENVMVCLSSSDTSSMYVYKYHIAGREKLQSAWFKYTFNGLNILDAEFMGSALYVLGNKGGKTILGTVSFDAGRFDTNQNYVTRLDYRFPETACTVVYNPDNDRTYITTPYALVEPFVVKRGADQGTTIPVFSSNGAGYYPQVVVTGDHSATEFYVGEKYLMTYEFSPPNMKEPTAKGGRVSIAGGRLQIKHWLLRYQDSGDFIVKVIPTYGGNSSGDTYASTGRFIGGGSTVLGTTTLSSGEFRFPVMVKSDRLRVVIECDSHLPCQFLSAEWEGQMHLRSRRLNG